MSKSVTICGTGSYVPEEIVTNQELEKMAPTDAEWVETKLGIKRRRRLGEDECTSDMAVEAARRALEQADMCPEDVELVIVGTVTPDRLVPSVSTRIQGKLGAENAVAYDLNAACAGYLFGKISGAQFIKNGFFKNALIIGSDAMSRITDYTDRTCVYYGDAAGAVVLKETDSGNGILSSYFQSDGDSGEHVTIKGCGAEMPASEKVLENRWQYLYMGGRDVYEVAVDRIPHSIIKAMELADITPADVTYLVPHQPNISLLKECAAIAGISEEKVVISLDEFANASSANIPLALDMVNREGRLKEGDILLFVSIGAGWTWGSMALKWGE